MTYVNISGTLQDSVIIDKKSNITYTITIEGPINYNYSNAPVSRYELKTSGDYSFQLLKGSSYNINITRRDITKNFKNSQNLIISIPELTDDTQTYELSNFEVSDTSPIIQKSEIELIEIIKDNKSYYLSQKDNGYGWVDVENNIFRPFYNQRRGGLLVNSSFEYEISGLTDGWELITNDGGVVSVSYTTDILTNTNDVNTQPGPDSKSIQLTIDNIGSTSESIQLRQKLDYDKININEEYLIKFLFKYINGVIFDNPTITITNEIDTLVDLGILNISEDNNGWILISQSGISTSNQYLMESSKNIYLNINLGIVGNGVSFLLDEMSLHPLYQQTGLDLAL